MTQNVRRHFGVEQAFPFDWWITPILAIKPLLQNGFDLGIDPDNLELTVDGKSVLNRRWQILHHHDFQRKDGLIVEDWKNHIPSVRDKYAFLFQRMVEAFDHSRSATIFINGNGGHEYLTREYRLSCSQPGIYTGIFDALKDRWPHLKITPVVCNPPPTSEPPADAIILRVQDYGDREPGKDFAKSVRGWNEAFSTLTHLAGHQVTQQS